MEDKIQKENKKALPKFLVGMIAAMLLWLISTGLYCGKTMKLSRR